jgi:signal peptidase I
MRVVLSALSWLGTLLAVVVGSLALVVILAGHFSPAGQYTVFGHPVLSVLSGSMSPAIRTGDVIVDDPVSGWQAAHLHVGQIITFSAGARGQRFFTHRIVAVHGADRGGVSYTTKGDANDAPDAKPVPSAAVIGVFKGKLTHGGYVLEALRRPLVLALLLLAVLLSFLAGPALRLLHQARQRTN